MKQVLHIFLFLMISLVQAREDPLLQEDPDGTPTSHQESRQLKASEDLKYPYIDEKCCNLTTTYPCSRIGGNGFKGHCMPRNETCLGREFFGTKYCLISNLASCKCCVPTDCKKQTLPSCAALNGTCIGLNDHCNGTSVVSEEFCGKDSKHDTCKCCFPLVPPDDCPCGQDYGGMCRGLLPNGKDGHGHCMKTCDPGIVSLRDSTCNTTGGSHCKCCDINDYCGATCESSNPMNCICVINGKQCPKGYCSHPKADLCPHDGCSCCKENLSGTCPKPFKKFGSEYFYFHDSSKKNWDEALDHCKSIGGSLAEPSNIDDFITLINSSYSHMTADIWLGATDRSSEQDWKWLSGGSVPDTLWPAWPGNQPSGDGDCMQIHHHDYSGFFLNDYYCHVKGYFVCECTPQVTIDCLSKPDQCTAPNDYCVDKLSVDCPAGFSKLNDACSSSVTLTRDGKDSKQKDCDCCKSNECSSIGDRCTGKGSFCIDSASVAVAKCPNGYTQSPDCSRTVIKNGTIVGFKICICCKPKTDECSKGCFQIGSQCFMRLGNTSIWDNAKESCGIYKQQLAEPQDPQALSQYLAANYPDEENYWIGAHGTANDNAVWVSGGVIGPNAPWIENGYAACDHPLLCMFLKAHSNCYNSDKCLGCTRCESHPTTLKTTICSCDNSLKD